MFDIGWSEMAIIMVAALIIIGPKDLPRVARTIGQWVRKGRMLAREFQNSLDDMVRETELEDVKKEIEKVGRTDIKKAVENTIDPKGELTKAFDPDADNAATKPALANKSGADKSGADDNKMPVKAAANGHASGATTTSSKPAAKTAKKPAPKKGTSAKSTKTANRSKKPAAKTTASKPASARKSTTTTKKTAKPTTSTAKPKAKRSPAKGSASEKVAVDEGGGADPAAVAAKSS